MRLHIYPAGAESARTDGGGADFQYWNSGNGGAGGTGIGYDADDFGDGFAFGDADGGGGGDSVPETGSSEIYDGKEFTQW